MAFDVDKLVKEAKQKVLDESLKQLINNKQATFRNLKDLLTNPIFSDMGDMPWPLHKEENEDNREFGVNKRANRAEQLSWIKSCLPTARFIANVIDLAGPEAAKLGKLWRDAICAAKLRPLQGTKITLIDRVPEYVQAAKTSPYVHNVLQDDFWGVAPKLLSGKGRRGNIIISLDFCGTLGGARTGDQENPDCRVALPELLNQITGDYEYIFLYLTVANRVDGTESIIQDLNKLKDSLSIGPWICSDHKVTKYKDTHPMLSAVYCIKKS